MKMSREPSGTGKSAAFLNHPRIGETFRHKSKNSNSLAYNHLAILRRNFAMRKRKAAGERVVNAGISLPPGLIEHARECARIEGFETLTNLTRYLLTQWLQEVENRWELHEIEREKLKASPPVPPPKKRGRPRKGG
jgi:hypothetical protein